MIRLKKIFFVSSFALMTFMAKGQAVADTHIGLYSTFLSSDSLKSSPGLGLELGARSQAKINSRFDFFTDYSIYLSTFSVTGYSFSEDASFNPIIKKTSSSFYKVGLNYSAGVDYFIVPDQFSVGAGLGIAVNYVIAGNNADSLGAAPSLPATSAPIARAGDLQKFNFDYGVHINAIYRLSKVQFSLDYFKGFSSLTSGFNTTMNDIMIGVHFHLRDFSYAKPYQNKLTK